MSLQEVSAVSAGEGEWVVVDQQWWRTPFDSVSWSYQQGGIRERAPLPSFSKKIHPLGAVYGPPMRAHSYDEQGFGDKGNLRVYGEDEDTALNPELAGVKAAVDAISTYETSVGFYHATQSLPLTHAEFPPSSTGLHIDASDSDVQHGRELWNQWVGTLTGGLTVSLSELDTEESNSTRMSDFSPLSTGGGLHSSTSTLSSIDLSSLDIPLTPRATSVTNVAIKDSPLVDSDFSHQASSRLNASASTFVPSFHVPPNPSLDDKLPLPSLQDFTFPSIDRPTSVKITKDDQGFVTDVEVEDPKLPTSQQPRSSSALLPAFLSEVSPSRRKATASKTRALVDKLRSSVVNQGDKADWSTPSGRDRLPDARAKSASISPSPSPFELVDFFKPRLSVSEDGGDLRDRESATLEPDEEGWFSFSAEDQTEEPPVVTEVTKDVPKPNAHDKAKRAQALFLALNRYRGSTSPSGSDEKEDSLYQSHFDDEGTTISQSTQQSSPPHTPTDHSTTAYTSRADSRASSSSSKKRSKRTPPFVSVQQQHQQHSRPLAISIPPAQPTFTPVMAMPPMTSLPYPASQVSQYPHPSVGALPYMPPHPQSYLGMSTPINHYLQMQVQLQLQMQGLVPSHPSVRPLGAGDWITPGRPLTTLASAAKPGQHHPTPALEATFW